MATFSWTDIIYGTPSDPSQINAMGRAVQDLVNPARTCLRDSVGQSLANGAVVPLSWNVEDFDNFNCHDTVVNPTRWVCPFDGWWQLAGGVGFSANVTGIRTAQWMINGSDVAGGQAKVKAVTDVGVATCLPTRTLDLIILAGQYVELGAFQNSGGALATSATLNEQSNATIRLLLRL